MVRVRDKQSNQIISSTALGYWSTEDQVYSVTGMSSNVVQKMSGKTVSEVTAFIQNFIKTSDQRIRHRMGLPYTIRKEFHVFHFNEQFREFGPAEDQYEFFDYYDPTDRVEKVFAIYSNKKRMKYPFPKNCDDLTEDTTVVSTETAIDNMQWDITGDSVSIETVIGFTGYTNCVPADIGDVVLMDASPTPIPIGTLYSYDNINQIWTITVSINTLIPAGSVLSTDTLGHGGITVTDSIFSNNSTILMKDITDFMAGTASLKTIVAGSNGGSILFPKTQNLQKQQYPWDYLSFWMKTSDPNAKFTFRMYDVLGRSVSQEFYCGNNNFNMTLGFNPALTNAWQIVALKFMCMTGYAGGVNWVFVPVQYFTIEVDRPCTFWIDNLNWNDGIFFTAPKGLLCWARSEISAIADELEVTYSFDPFKQEVPEDISFGSAKMAGILLLEYLIGIRQRSTAFTQSSDALATSPDKETLEFTKARLEREVDEFLSGIGFKSYSGIGAEG